MSLIRIRGLGKSFREREHGQTTLFRHLATLLRTGGRVKERDALCDVDLDIYPGERIGVIGGNGAGKTTLMRIIAGIYPPTCGELRLDGSVAAILQLGLGVIGRLSVRENIFLYGAILGLTRGEIRRRFDEILQFSELESVADMEVRRLSAGMVQRLSFSVAIQVDADLLLLDEVLAVGDRHFKSRCYDYFANRMPRSRAMLFASHDLREIRRFCERTLWLERGRVVTVDETERVLDRYESSPH
jgi:ABC-type polysaccharide/polyol phosphate transport system ATPase subunit